MVYLPDARAEGQLVVARWPSRVEFRYRTVRNEDLAQWPPWTTKPQTEGVLLPGVIEVIAISSGDVAMAFQVPAPAEWQSRPGTDPFSGRAGS